MFVPIGGWYSIFAIGGMIGWWQMGSGHFWLGTRGGAGEGVASLETSADLDSPRDGDEIAKWIVRFCLVAGVRPSGKNAFLATSCFSQNELLNTSRPALSS